MVTSFNFVLSVIAAKDGLPEGRLRTILEAARAAAKLGDVDVLAADHAYDIPFSGNPKEIRAVVAGAADPDWRLDINVMPARSRRKKLLVADMDSTIIGCECIDELADMAGLKPKVAAITERAMRGELDFPAALRERVALLKGLKLDALARVLAERVRLNRGARVLLATMRAHGARSILVSGGFTYFTRAVALEAGFDENQGNILIDDGAALTGEVAEPILGREAKLRALEDAVRRLGIDYSDTIGVGDGANDLDMIRRSGLGVAYHAKPVVAEAAGTAIAHGDLTGLLYLQGYRAGEFVHPQPL